jgi:hypothetical protein
VRVDARNIDLPMTASDKIVAIVVTILSGTYESQPKGMKFYENENHEEKRAHHNS